MSRILLFLSLIWIINTGCASDPGEDIVGTWQLTEESIDNANVEKVVFEPIVSEKVLTFQNDDKYECSGDLCGLSISTDIGSSGSYGITNNVIIIENCFRKIPYTLDGDVLILDYECIESCFHKYQRL